MPGQIRYLEGLIPSDALLHIPFDEDIEDGDVLSKSLDAAIGPNPSPEAGSPAWVVQVNKYRGVRFDGTNQLFVASGIEAIGRHFFIVASYDDALFDAAYDGLASVVNVGNESGLWLGETGGVDTWFNFGIPDQVYRKDGIDTNVGPMSGIPSLLELEVPGGGAYIENFYIARDRSFATRNWLGTIAGIVISPRVLTGYELDNLRLWGQLVAKSTKSTGILPQFPKPQQIFGGTIDAYSKLEDLPEDFSDADLSNEYSDGGRSFYEISPVGLQGWEIEFNSVSMAKRQVLDEFAALVRTSRPFTFYDYRHGRTETVRLAARGYRARHNKHESWRHNCSFQLVKYPGS